jgi:hypothetical protein
MRTDDTWTRRIRSIEELPARYQARFGSGTLPEILLTPAVDPNWGERSERIIVLEDDGLTVLEADGDDAVRELRLAYRDIRSLDFGRVLLQTWITLDAATDGQPVRLTLQFNAAVEPLFRPIIARFRHLQAGIPLSDSSGRVRAMADELDFLLRANLKFYNYANMNVPPGAAIRDVLYEAAVRQRRAKVLHVVRIPTQILVLTDRELIRITEEKPRSALFRVRSSYGAIATYLPLSRVAGAEVLTGEEGDTVRLRVTLDAGERTWTFAAGDEAALQELARRLRPRQAA